MPKVTKTMLIKENEALKSHIKELEVSIEQLKKEKAVLEGRLQVYEQLPQNAANALNDTIKFVTGWSLK